MAPDELHSQLQQVIDDTSGVSSAFSVESGLILASALVKNPKVKTGLAWGGLAWSAGQQVWRKVKDHRARSQKTYCIKIDVDDPIFDVVSSWITDATPEAEQFIVEIRRSWRVTSRNTSDALDEMFGLNKYNWRPITEEEAVALPGGHQKFTIEVDGEKPLPLHIGKHLLEVKLMLPGETVTQGSPRGYDSQVANNESYRNDPYYVVRCPSLEARREFLKAVDEALPDRDDEDPAPSVWRADAWGKMNRVASVPPRRLDTVVLKHGQMEALVEDIAKFLASEEYYVGLGMPYHRGIMLYGDPGTGKTSIAAAVATAFNLDVYAVSIASIRDDNTLASLFDNIRSRSVLLLEDVDTCAVTNDRTKRDVEKDGPGITMGGLLQALDGFTAPHGLITIMTTNRLEVLDPALVRSGRADLKLQIDCVDTDQVQRLCERFIKYVPDGIPEIVPFDRIAPGEVVEVFKQYIYHPEDAGPALVKRLNELLDAGKK